jgi:hypothetical protein
MPQSIYDIVGKADFEKSVVGETTHNEPNAQGRNVERWDYDKWGGCLSKPQIISANDGGSDLNQMFNMSGMARMDASTKKQNYSGYYTLRVVSAVSAPGSWIKPATPASHVTQGVKLAVEREVNKLFEAGFRRDLGR